MPTIIETFNLTKRFPRYSGYLQLFERRTDNVLTAVDGVNLQIHEAEVLALLGSNGAGKTTLSKILCTLVLPTDGRALICGRDVVREASAVRKLVGMVDGQERSFYWRLSARQNLEFFAALHNLSGQAAQTRIDELLALVGLTEHADRRFMSFSTGMRQRLAIARGLLVMPRVLFMDEVTRSLDPKTARDLRAFVRKRLVEQLGCTVIWVTHRLEEAEEICDRVAIMKRGQVLDCASVAELQRHLPARQVYRLKVGGLPPDASAALRNLPGVLDLECNGHDSSSADFKVTISDEEQVLPQVIDLLVRQGAKIQHCSSQAASLEEAFLYLTDGERRGL
ncbi:MAG: ABC transporter ATP-binding protein [Chloroflexi bacterium]|nr:ABC transporter ATP-binding protein [Chloroflexota bacterium]